MWYVGPKILSRTYEISRMYKIIMSYVRDIISRVQENKSYIRDKSYLRYMLYVRDNKMYISTI